MPRNPSDSDRFYPILSDSGRFWPQTPPTAAFCNTGPNPSPRASLPNIPLSPQAKARPQYRLAKWLPFRWAGGLAGRCPPQGVQNGLRTQQRASGSPNAGRGPHWPPQAAISCRPQTALDSPRLPIGHPRQPPPAPNHGEKKIGGVPISGPRSCGRLSMMDAAGGTEDNPPPVAGSAPG
jgi:hypothetical protein